MKFSELSYLTLKSLNDEQLIEFIDPILKIRKEFSEEELIDFLIENFEAQITPNDKDEAKKISHWWNRNWAVSLDFYLSSIDEEKRRFSIFAERSIKEIISPFQVIMLNKHKKSYKIDFLTALLNRKTYRKFLPVRLPIETFSSFLQSLSDFSPSIFTKALDYYIVIFNVEEISEGIYRYCQNQHSLEGISKGNFRKSFRDILCGMATTLTASFVVIMVADCQFLQDNLSFNRALRNVYVESGRVGQHLLIRGMQYNLGGLPSPAMKDTEMASILGLDIAQQIPIYSLIMGIIPPSAEGGLDND